MRNIETRVLRVFRGDALRDAYSTDNHDSGSIHCESTSRVKSRFHSSRIPQPHAPGCG